MTSAARVPVTVLTGFLGAGKTTLLRHLLTHAGGRRIAVIVNEFGTVGIDGALLRDCGIPGCAPGDIVELANGCLCCTVADEFVPAMSALLDRVPAPEHIVIETSGLALPKPLLKAFGWPGLRARTTVDGVVAVIDTAAVAAGRFADDAEAISRERAADAAIEHDNPLAEVFDDQLWAADLIVLSKADLVDAATLARVRAQVTAHARPGVGVLAAAAGEAAPGVLLGLTAGAEDDLDRRPSHHDGALEDHEHDDFESFVVAVPAADTLETVLQRVRDAALAHDLLRIKGFIAVQGRPLRAVLQGVGPRTTAAYDRPWRSDESREGQLVVIGRTGLDRPAITAMLRG